MGAVTKVITYPPNRVEIYDNWHVVPGIPLGQAGRSVQRTGAKCHIHFEIH